jgi:Leucine-rich repeat (LRR) protein
LQWLSCNSNELTGLDVSGNSSLYNLWCGNNRIASLDVSKNIVLRLLDCHSNQLTSLDVSNNTALESICLSYLPALGKVCVWELPFPPEGVELFTEYSPNVYFTTDCSK